MTSNDQLKKAYQKLHARVVETINADYIIRHLFANEILSEDDNYKLAFIADRVEKAVKLMAILHASSHQRAFIELHETLKKEEAYKFLVEVVEKLCRARGKCRT